MSKPARLLRATFCQICDKRLYQRTARARLRGFVAGNPRSRFASLTFHQVSGGGRDRFLLRHAELIRWACLSPTRLRLVARNIYTLLSVFLALTRERPSTA